MGMSQKLVTFSTSPLLINEIGNVLILSALLFEGLSDASLRYALFVAVLFVIL